MTSSDRTPARPEAPVRPHSRMPMVTTLAPLATALVLAFTGHGEAAIAALAAAGAASAVQITIHIRR
ncbi:hypothetical protein [Streptomyces sp. NPDC045251]|uniref:hypothetical protein n=1 Tax=unclassified Streptomyces TaxID=2593676 RepID=UPI0033EB614B